MASTKTPARKIREALIDKVIAPASQDALNQIKKEFLTGASVEQIASLLGAVTAAPSAPKDFTSRELSNADDSVVLVVNSAANATVPASLINGFIGIFNATSADITFTPADATVTIANNDFPHSGWVALINVGEKKYDVIEASSGIGNGPVPTKVSDLTNDSGFQTAAQVDARIAEIVGAAPTDLDTLKEIGDRLVADETGAAALLSAIAEKADLVGGKVPSNQLPALGSLGTYATTTALQTAHPAASNAGASAMVGTAAPYTEYVSDGSAWVQVPAINAPVTLTGATTLTRALHANRQIIFNGANATLTIPNDATGGWGTDDSFEVHTLNGSAGVPTLVTPDGKSITGSATKIIGATRKGADQWTVGTTDPAAAAAGGTVIDMTTGNSFAITPSQRGTTVWSYVGTSAPGNVGTTTARTTAFSVGAYVLRLGIVSAASANTNSYIGTTSGAEMFVSPDTNALFPPQRCRVVFGVSDALSACRTGVGFMPGTPSATVEPSTILNSVMFAADSTDTQLTLMCNDGSGTATKTVLNGGTGFPANSNSADLYDCYLELVGGATRALNYCITNKITGVKASGTVTSKLPVAGTLMRAVAYRNTAANASAASIEIFGIFGGGYAQMGPVA